MPPTEASPEPTVDPREEEDLFKRLPFDAKQQLRERWRRQAVAEARIEDFRRATRKRTMLSGAILFLVMETIFAYAGWLRTLAAIVTGAGVGLAWHMTRVRRFGYVLVGVGPHLAFRYYFGFGEPFTAFFGLLAFVVFSVALGISHESRLGDGTDLY